MVFMKAGLKVKVEDMEGINSHYSAISVLRLLLLMEREKLAELARSNILSESLMDHNLERREAQPEIWQLEQDHMVDFIHQKCGLQDRFTAEEIHAANGRIMMNATSLELSEQRIARPDFWVRDRDRDFISRSLNDETRPRLFFF